jgi:hypothetical protein
MQITITTGPFAGALQKGEAELLAENGRVFVIALTAVGTPLEIPTGKYSLRRVFLTLQSSPNTISERWQYEFLRYPYGNKPAFPLQISEKTTIINLLPKAEFALYVGGGRRVGEALYPRVTVQTDLGLTLARMITPPTLTEARAEISLQDSAGNIIDSDIARFT